MVFMAHTAGLGAMAQLTARFSLAVFTEGKKARGDNETGPKIT